MQQPPKPNAEELRVLAQCRQDASRDVAIGTFASILLARGVVKYQFPNLRRLPKIGVTLLAGFLGLSGGLAINHELCMKRLMQLRNSPLSDFLHRARGLPVPPRSELEPDADGATQIHFGRQGDLGEEPRVVPNQRLHPPSPEVSEAQAVAVPASSPSEALGADVSAAGTFEYIFGSQVAEEDQRHEARVGPRTYKQLREANRKQATHPTDPVPVVLRP
eukprot:m.288835 g.288835  ORF g.288835 m.288835 type:complete len:219 (+) comp55056_c0_seq5:162-818(+)